MATRQADHAGSWYTSDPNKLDRELNGYLDDASTVDLKANQTIKALIGPHAGFRYCGPTGAYAYKSIDPTSIKRVFILGPSHHVYLDNCAISCATVCETPLGNLTVDTQTIATLSKQIHFEKLTIDQEEEEHSLEMHMPWIAKTFKLDQIKVVPIMLSDTKAKAYGKILRPYLEDEETFFVISSDFCHWGKRFGYTYHDPNVKIHQSIEALDRKGMDIIESLDPQAFTDYIKKYKNTICGRFPIIVLLYAVQDSKRDYQMSFVDYSQSSACVNMDDSSVSYASGVLIG